MGKERAGKLKAEIRKGEDTVGKIPRGRYREEDTEKKT
jgi:hypothetical protein